MHIKHRSVGSICNMKFGKVTCVENISGNEKHRVCISEIPCIQSIADAIEQAV